MTNQLAKFMPNLAQINSPLHKLLIKDQSWIWDEAQATAFQKTKNLPLSLLITLPSAKQLLPQTPR